jgi:hypothetical protein
MTEFEVDKERFQKLLTANYRHDVAEIVRCVLDTWRGGETVNRRFFGEMESYRNQQFHISEMCLPDLFAPNICAIDFALDHFDKDADSILDYGCGLGVCGNYLSELGFKAFGCDNWAQIPKRMADEFCRRRGTSFRIVEHPEIEPTVVQHVAIWCIETAVWDRPSVKWILSDTHYLNSFDGDCPAGFEMFGFYGSYLTVFKRK